MVNYQLGKVYELVCLTTGKRYIGSTTKRLLCMRLAEHVAYLTKTTSSTANQIIIGGNYKINLLEAYPCNTKDELCAKEYEWINKLECVNIIKGFRTEERRKEYMKEYHKKQKELTSSSPSVSSPNPPPPPSQQTEDTLTSPS